MPKKVVEAEYKVTGDEKAKKKLTGLKGAFASIGKSIKNFLSPAKLLTIALLAIGAAVVKTVKTLTSIQTKMVNVGNLFGATREEVNKLTDDIIKLGTQTPQKVEDLALALFDVVSAGVPAGEAIEFLGVAAKLATAGITTTTIAVDGLTSAMNAYGIEASEAEAVSDKFFAAQVKGKTTIAELSQSIGTVAPIAAAAGVSLDELLGSIAALTVQGIKTNQATVGIRQAITSLIKPTEDATKLSRQLGIEFDANALKQKGLSGVLKDVIKKTGGNTTALGKLFGNVKALNTVLALSKNNFEALDESQKAVTESAGVMETAYQQNINTLNAQWQLIKNNSLALGKFLLGWLVPTITFVLKSFNKMADGIRKGFELIERAQNKFKTLFNDGWESSVNVHKKASSAITDEEKKQEAERLKLLKEAKSAEVDLVLKANEEKSKADKKAEEDFKNTKQAMMDMSTAAYSHDKGLIAGYGEFLKQRLISEINAFFSARQAEIIAIGIANWWNPIGWGALAQVAGLEVAKQGGIAAVNAVGFADGGIVPGNSFSGDRVSAGVNSGEMILNRDQQRNLFNVASQGVGDIDNSSEFSGGGGERVIILDSDGSTILAKGVYQKQTDMLRTGELQARR